MVTCRAVLPRQVPVLISLIRPSAHTHSFVDYESISHATKGMVAHQNFRFPGVSLNRGGLLIDYDKDSRSKRNRAYEKGKRT
jgi:hypothetical protein